MNDTLVPFHKLPVAVSRMTLGRWIAAGTFPAPADTICGRRYWSAADVEAWRRDGRRSGWLPDAGASARREMVAARMHAEPAVA